MGESGVLSITSVLTVAGLLVLPPEVLLPELPQAAIPMARTLATARLFKTVCFMLKLRCARPARRRPVVKDRVGVYLSVGRSAGRPGAAPTPGCSRMLSKDSGRYPRRGSPVHHVSSPGSGADMDGAGR